MQKKIVIIGAGPAGISAAIQLKRYKLDSLLFEAGEIGGLLHNAWRVENYPGFPESISGMELAGLFKRQLEAFDIEVRKERIELLEYYDTVKRFELRTIDASFSPEYVIVASGTKPRQIHFMEMIPDDCRAMVFRDIQPLQSVEQKRITILGAGDAAFDYALNLADRNEIVLLNRSDNISALPVLKDLVMSKGNITYCENAELYRIEKNSDENLAITIGKFEEQWLMETDFLVVAVGREECKDFFSDNFRKMEKVLIDRGIVYLIGDVKNGRYRQTSISVGDGVLAAMRINDAIMNGAR